MKKDDFLGMVLLMSLYTIQGVLLTLFTSTFPLIFSEKGLSISRLSCFNLASLPFSLKILFAPFLDKYFSRTFGQRKTYIVPLGYLAGLVLLISSYKIQDWKDAEAIEAISSLGFLIVLIIAIQDIAVDAWGVVILQDLSIGPFSQGLGMPIGFLLANTLFFKFQMTEIVFMQNLGILLLLVTIVIHFFIPENGFKGTKKKGSDNSNTEISDFKSDESKEITNSKNINKDNDNEEEKNKSISIFQMFKGFLENQYLRKLLIISLVQTLGVGPILSMFILKVQKAGITKEQLSYSSQYSFPAKIALLFIIKKYFKNSLSATQVVLVIQFFFQIFQFIFYFLQKENYFWTFENHRMILLILIQLGDTIILTSLIQIKSTFFAQISSKGMEGMYLTMFSSIQNLSRKITISTFQFLDAYIDFNFITITMWILHIGFIYKSQKIYKEMDGLTSKDWSLFNADKRKKVSQDDQEKKED